jgi:hypothetical protein
MSQFIFSSYRAGYLTGRLFTKVVKAYLTTKVVKSTCREIKQVAKKHKIKSNDASVVMENIFECLQYLD